MTKYETIDPPRAEKRQHADTHHGVTRQDEYAWLKAPNWQAVMQDPSVLPEDIRRYLEAENAYTERAMAGTRALQDRLFAEMKGRIKEDDSSVPAPDGPYAYYSSYVAGAEHPRYCRKARDLSGPEEILVDGTIEAGDKPFFDFGGFAVSPDHRLLAWSSDDKGSEFFRLRVRDLATGKDLADEIDNTAGRASWAADGKSFLYTQQDEHHRPLKVFRHVLGTPAEADALVYEETNAGFFAGVGKTQSDRFFVIDTHDHETSEAYLIDTATPEAAPRLVAPRRTGIEYDVEHWKDRLVIRTNADGAEDFKIVTAPLAAPGRENWRDLVPHRPGCLVLGIIALKSWLIRLERENGLPRIVVREMRTGAEHEIAFAEEAYALGFGQMLEYDTDTLRFSYSSMTTPAEVHDYDMRSRSRVMRKRQEVPSGHDPAQYVTRRIQAPAHDGETVPVTLLHRKDTPLEGSAPLWLYGYGSYGITIPAAFNTNILSLVDRGFIYAIAHIRGGQDKGYRWYTEGKREKKQNTFHDFISAARHLIAAGYTRQGSIVAQGGSAGGMLMGAVANMAPELFKAVIAEVPFVDVLTTMLDDTLPLTPPEWPEWGNPIASREFYDVIAAYSPYDNVAARDYPNILAVGGLTDPRVTYWEPAKWVARLRDRKTDRNLLLLRTQMEAGHGGAPGRFDRLKEVALSYAFGLMMSAKADV
ncbi:MAG: S9 family peptidase [Parvibaculaceae bacterium]